MLTTERQISQDNLAKINLNIHLPIPRRQHRWLYARVCANYRAVRKLIPFWILVERQQFKVSVTNRMLCRKTVPFTNFAVVRFRVVAVCESSRTLSLQHVEWLLTVRVAEHSLQHVEWLLNVRVAEHCHYNTSSGCWLWELHNTVTTTCRVVANCESCRTLSLQHVEWLLNVRVAEHCHYNMSCGC